MIMDGSYPSLLQGVSQQIVQNRIEGQLTEQVNMLSDAVTGLRRRPGSVFKQSQVIDSDNIPDTLHATYLELGDTGYHVFVNRITGSLRIYDEAFTFVFEHNDSYLQANSTSSIRSVTQSGYTWFLNTEKAPVLGGPKLGQQNPDHSGWVNILTGAYGRTYTVTITLEGYTHTYAYTTPSGTAAGDVALSTPNYIASQLLTAMLADSNLTTRLNIYSDGPYFFFNKKVGYAGAFTDVKITSSAGALYVRTSNKMLVPLSTDLPASLPVEGDGAVMAVGKNPLTYTYYQWVNATGVWKETASYGSSDSITNMPQRLRIEEGVFTYDAPAFEGRLAGNADNNPYAAFVTYGITGISAYQGRLVLLAGGYCCMSASDRPLRFMRSTLEDLRDDDPIEISAGALASASFKYAIPFNKDLILISAAHQAVIPAGNTGITPKNALVLLSSTEAVCTNSVPTIMGRTLMYGTSVSKELFGVGELIPSQYADSQYTANNLTGHIPSYMRGQCRGITSNSGDSSGYFLSAGKLDMVLVNEYLWAGDERVQNAWHKWVFPFNVLSIHSAKGTLVFAFKEGNSILICTIDTRTAQYQQAGIKPTFADAVMSVNVVDNKFTVPVPLRTTSIYSSGILSVATGSLAGEPIPLEDVDPLTWVATTGRSFPSGSAKFGCNYVSLVTPSSALIRDKEGQPILTANTNILRYMVNVKNTGEFNIKTTVTGYPTDDVIDSALTWSSSELGLGRKQEVAYGTVIIPVRAYSNDTDTTLSTDGTREMNIVSIDYTLRGVLKRKRL